VEIVIPLKPWIAIDFYSGTKTCSSQYEIDMFRQVYDCEQGYGFGLGFDYIVDLDNVGCVIQTVSCSSSSGTCTQSVIII